MSNLIKEESKWKDGFVSGAVYQGDEAHIDFKADVAKTRDAMGVHICLTHRHSQAGLAEKFIADLNDAVAKVKADPEKETDGVGRLYGMSANIPINGVMDAFLKCYMDLVLALMKLTALRQPGLFETQVPLYIYMIVNELTFYDKRC